jgi:hypothetical protein
MALVLVVINKYVIENFSDACKHSKSFFRKKIMKQKKLVKRKKKRYKQTTP